MQRVGHGMSLWAQFSGSRSKMSNDLQNSEWSAWTIVYKTVNRLEFGWSVMEKSRFEHDPRLSRLCDLLPTGSRLWCHFRRDYCGLRGGEFWSCWLKWIPRYCKKIISWRRRRRRWTSTIALNENAFAFRLKIKHFENFQGVTTPIRTSPNFVQSLDLVCPQTV